MPGRDIDFIPIYNIDIKHISTLGMHLPANSDHQGIGVDIDISALFNRQYSTIASTPHRTLTMNNVRVKNTSLKYTSSKPMCLGISDNDGTA
jgi:hypothetical protein